LDPNSTMIDRLRARRTFAPEGEGTGGDTTQTTTTGGETTTSTTGGDTTQTTTTQTSAKWWEGERFADPARQYLTAKGLTVDDPMEAMPKLVDIAANAEKRIGKGLDSILDKPTKDQPWTDWVAKNRDSLGLPADEKGYEVARPENWPKDAPWNDQAEAAAKAIAVKYGIPKDALQELVNLQAADAMRTYQTAAALGEEGKRALMADLEKDFGEQVPKVLHQARLGAQFIGEKAGLNTEAIANLSDVLTEKIGDANAIRAFRVIGEMLGDDTAVGLGKGGGLTTTPAEARAEIARLRAPDGEYFKAVKSGDRNEIARVQPTIDRLTRIAAGS
jgi:hypothetical protein